MSQTHRTMIVPAQLVETVRSLADTWPGGVGMFITPLAPVDTEETTPTHYISTGLINAEIAAVMPWVEHGVTDSETGETTDVQHLGTPDALAQMLSEQHPDASADQLLTIIAACDISEQSPIEAMGRLGLRVVREAA